MVTNVAMRFEASTLAPVTVNSMYISAAGACYGLLQRPEAADYTVEGYGYAKKAVAVTNTASALYMLGMFAYNLHKLDEATNSIEQAIIADPTNADYLSTKKAMVPGFPHHFVGR